MKRIILALAFLIFSAPAFAGSITFTVSSGATSQHPSGFAATKSYTISDANMEIFYTYASQSANAGGFYGNPAPTCTPTPCTPTQYTLPQSLLAWTQSVIQGTINNIQASGTAAPVVPAPIVAQ